MPATAKMVQLSGYHRYLFGYRYSGWVSTSAIWLANWIRIESHFTTSFSTPIESWANWKQNWISWVVL